MSTETSIRVRKGSCLCGGIKLEAKGDPIRAVLCHCVNCQKGSGSAFMNNAIYREPGNVVVFDENNLLTSYDDGDLASGGLMQRSFCSKCGSNMTIRPTDKRIVVVCTGIFDSAEDRDELAPQAELFCSSQRKWWNELSNERLDTEKFAENYQIKKRSDGKL